MKRYAFKMSLVLMCLVLMCLVLIGMSAQGVFAQNYPLRPIRLIVPSSAGSNIDLVARLIAPGLTQALGQQVIVDNREGAGNNIGAEIAARAPADGYTVLMGVLGHAVNVSLYRKLSYDLVRDFAAVTRLSETPQIVVCHPSFPAKSISDLVKLAKAKPGAINYSSAGAGTVTFLAGELFKMLADVDMVEVRYKGGGEALTAVVSGEVQVFFAPLAVATPFIQQGKLRLLAVGSAKRLSVLPECPTVAESGYPNYEVVAWYGLLVPAKTPKKTIATIREAAVAALKRPDVSKRLNDLGFTTIGDQPEDFAKYLKLQIEMWGKIIRKAGSTVD